MKTERWVRLIRRDALRALKTKQAKKEPLFLPTRVSHTIACLQIPASDLNSHPSPV